MPTSRQSGIVHSLEEVKQSAGVVKGEQREEVRNWQQWNAEYGTFLNTRWINNEIQLLNLCVQEIETGLDEIRDQILRVQPMKAVAELSVSSSSKKKQPSNLDNVQNELENNPELLQTVRNCFEKLKFASLLTSRLDGFMHQPNAEDLTRQIYSTTRKVMNCLKPRDAKAFPIASSISKPVFPKFTVRFLRNALKGNEAIFLNQLGPEWNTPKGNKETEVYSPTFRNGYDVHVNSYSPSLFTNDQSTVDQSRERRYKQKILLDEFARDVLKNNEHLLVSLGDHPTESNSQNIDQYEFLQLIKDEEVNTHVKNKNGKILLVPRGSVVKVTSANN